MKNANLSGMYGVKLLYCKEIGYFEGSGSEYTSLPGVDCGDCMLA